MSIQLYTNISGSGPALIILHGLFGSWENWGTQARLLSQHFTVYAMDARNHGRSPHKPDIDYALMANDVLFTMERMNIDKTSLIGHSMGGKTAMTVALAEPEKINRLIVVDISPREYPAGHMDIFQALMSLEISKLKSRSEADKHLKKTIVSPTLRAFLLKNLQRKDNGFCWKLNLPALHDNYPKITDKISSQTAFRGPTLFIKGANSDYIQAQDRAIISNLFPQAKAKIIDGAGHWPHSEKRSVFTKIATDFLMNGQA